MGRQVLNQYHEVMLESDRSTNNYVYVFKQYIPTYGYPDATKLEQRISRQEMVDRSPVGCAEQERATINRQLAQVCQIENHIREGRSPHCYTCLMGHSSVKLISVYIDTVVSLLHTYAGRE